MSDIKKNVEDLKKELDGFNGRIIAAVKYVDAKKTLEAYDAGLRDFGENRIQDALERFPLLPQEMKKNSTWHFIGHLQSNKVRKVVGTFDYIHSVDSFDISKNISRVASEMGIIQKILIEVNISGENSKYGFSEKEIFDNFESLAKLEGTRVVGLMTVAPSTSNGVFLEKVFTNLKELSYNIKHKYHVELSELSMGMSSDYKEAIKAGSTMIRLGKKIFL